MDGTIIISILVCGIEESFCVLYFIYIMWLNNMNGLPLALGYGYPCVVPSAPPLSLAHVPLGEFHFIS